MSLNPKDVETLLTPTQPCSTCGSQTPYFAVCRRCKVVLARCMAHGGPVQGLNEEVAIHRLSCKPDVGASGRGA